ncbi:MAG: TadE/TadG family type IV pilus assembly protein [Sphingomonadales bacterium]
MRRAMVRRAIRRMQLRHDARGAVLTELALIMPVFAALLLGALDAGHTLYLQATLQGAVQKAARDSGLETGLDATNQTAIDANVRSQVLRLVRTANVTITRRAYHSFSAASSPMEAFTDTNDNGVCDNNEPFNDDNNNGTRDQAGASGSGGAKDSVLYTVTAAYPRLFPLDRLIGLSSTVTLTASTIMNNQPYGDQVTATVGHCLP